MRLKKQYSFDDVMLVPRLSDLNTRAEADLSTKIAGVKLDIPVIAANMSSVCEGDMAIALAEMGGLGVIHRMCSVDQQAEMIAAVRFKGTELKTLAVGTPYENAAEDFKVGFSIGIGPDWRDRMDACRAAGGTIACLDVAHAHHKRVLELLDKYFGIYKDFPIIIGQVATPSAVRDIMNAHSSHMGTVAFKTSIGGGSLCTTRMKTGFGIPTLQAVMDIAAEFPHVSLIADGGIKESGDIVKSLAAGADAVMLGNILAGTEQAPGQIIKDRDNQLYKVYRGSASFGDKALRGEDTRNVEGEETLVPFKGSAYRVVQNLLDGIRSGFSYGGAKNIEELQDDIEFVELSVHGYHESLPHGK